MTRAAMVLGVVAMAAFIATGAFLGARVISPRIYLAGGLAALAAYALAIRFSSDTTHAR